MSNGVVSEISSSGGVMKIIGGSTWGSTLLLEKHLPSSVNTFMIELDSLVTVTSSLISMDP